MKRNTKRILCVLVSCSLLGAAAHPVLAAADASRSVPVFAFETAKVISTLHSVSARVVHWFLRTDETKRAKRDARAPSWTPCSKEIAPDSVETCSAKAWVMTELSFESNQSYADPFSDVEMDLQLCGNGRLYTIPAFWDGGNTWKVRLACPGAGTWSYRTRCTNAADSGLHGQTGKILCAAYDGKEEIYRRGFVRDDTGSKYFTFDDGTPFFYLGDTHWSLGDETLDMVRTICRTRREQGFTVFQSEPIGASFDLTDGVTDADLAGFAAYDAKFAAIAEAGLVHANASFFFPAYMQTLIDNHGGFDASTHAPAKTAQAYLRQLSRYWVARYSAYPVLWTLGQEVDDDFYAAADNHPAWNRKNNPYKLVAQWIAQYDAYDHPLSAHQENTGVTAAYGNGIDTPDTCRIYYPGANSSSFRNVAAHSFYAAQWMPARTHRSDCMSEKDFWYNGQGKPVINYEGQYCCLWTKDFGARMQGWTAFLSGMCGCAWGGQDTWSYLNTFDEENDSDDGVDTITSAEKKAATWEDALQYASARQLGYMRRFFSKTQWQNFIPRFNNHAYFAPCANVFHTYAGTADQHEIVVYFYSFSDPSVAQRPNSKGLGGLLTGTLGHLTPHGQYTLCWFDPITGVLGAEKVFTASAAGTYFVGEKPSGTDWVLWVHAADAAADNTTQS